MIAGTKGHRRIGGEHTRLAGSHNQAGNPARRRSQSRSSLLTSEPPMHFLTGYAKPITALAVSTDGKRLYSAAHGQELIWVWDLRRRTVEAKLRGAQASRTGIAGLAVAPCVGWLVSAAANCSTVVAWRLPEGVPAHAWYWHRDHESLAFHPSKPVVAGPMDYDSK